MAPSDMSEESELSFIKKGFIKKVSAEAEPYPDIPGQTTMEDFYQRNPLYRPLNVSSMNKYIEIHGIIGSYGINGQASY